MLETLTSTSETLVNQGAKAVLTPLLSDAGIEISESEPADIVVNDPSFYRRVLTQGSLGLGDSYMEGVWDSPHIDEVIHKILKSGLYQRVAAVYDIRGMIKSRVMNLQTLERAKQVNEEHYDLPVEFYELFLDPYFQYTCARFEGTDDLDRAQLIKMDNICQKISLKPGDKVLDFGGGWGGLARFMAEEYGAIPTVVTASKRQAKYIRETLEGKVSVEECDYRKIPDNLRRENFNAVTTVGAWEHIGHKNHDTLIDILDQCLKPGGPILVHSLFTPYSYPVSNPWSRKHIFPNGEIVPKAWMEQNLSRRFVPAGNSEYPTFEELTPSYPPTLHSWEDNSTEAREAGKIEIIPPLPLEERQIIVSKETGKVQMPLSELRKWRFYFKFYEGAIRAKHVRVGQFSYRKPGGALPLVA